jgi:hypothetical protein
MFVSSFGYKIIRIQKHRYSRIVHPAIPNIYTLQLKNVSFSQMKNLSKTLFGKLFYHDFFANSDKPLLYWVINLKFLSSQLHITWMWWLFWKCVRRHLHLSSLCISGIWLHQIFGCSYMFCERKLDSKSHLWFVCEKAVMGKVFRQASKRCTTTSSEMSYLRICELFQT